MSVQLDPPAKKRHVVRLWIGAIVFVAAAVTLGTLLTTSGSKTPAKAARTVKIMIRDVTTPDGTEPAFVGSDGVGKTPLFVVTANESVKVLVENTTDVYHTLVSGSLGLSVNINPTTTTSFTFIPGAPGTYTFNCLDPCGPWVMSHAGYMEGELKVVAS
jgi:heme/copper-type cytochrome/quinol oxidase subunit 2